jgi:hypothetical protein
MRAGQSQVLVVRGEAGIGKTALFEYVAERASGCRILRVGGVESEMELAFAGLHQLCAPLLDGWRVYPVRSAMRCVWHSACRTARPRIVSWWPCRSWACWPTQPK